MIRSTVFALLATAMLSQAAKQENGEVVLITGASSGIGYHTAKVLAASGYRVVVTARRLPKLIALVAEIEADGGVAAAVKLDVTSNDDYAAAFGFAEGRFGGVNHVFLNAGYEGDSFAGGLHETPKQSYDKVFKINQYAVLSGFQYSAKAILKTSKPGSITLCSSIAGGAHGGYALDFSGGWAYMMSKAAVDMLARVGYEYEAKHNIRVYGLKPNVYTSAMIDRIAQKVGMDVPVEQNGVEATGDALAAGFNMFFKGLSGNPVHIGHIVESFIDGSTQWKSGQNVICDNDGTYSADVQYRQVENPILSSEGKLGTGVFPDLVDEVRGYDGGDYTCKTPRSCAWWKKNYPEHYERVSGGKKEL